MLYEEFIDNFLNLLKILFKYIKYNNKYKKNIYYMDELHFSYNYTYSFELKLIRKI